MNLTELASILNADLVGDGNLEIGGVGGIEDAVAGQVTFIANSRYRKFLKTTEASAVIIQRESDGVGPEIRSDTALLKVDDPYLSFLRVMVMFHPPEDALAPGIHPSSVIDSDAHLGRDVRVGAHAFIGKKCSIGKRTMIGHNSVIGDNVSIGEDSVIYHNVTVREGCRIGSRTVIHAGTTIGSDGFGFAPKDDGTYEKIPQMGIVVVEDDVEIGSNCAVDRATIGETRIGKGVKLDNLIQVAHNVTIGENTVIAAQTGISGSTKIGKGGMIGGQVGITGHLTIAENTRIAAQSGIHRSVRKSGQALFGTPAKGKREAFKIQASLPQLPDLIDTVRRLKEAVNRLEERLSAKKPPEQDLPS